MLTLNEALDLLVKLYLHLFVSEFVQKEEAETEVD